MLAIQKSSTKFIIITGGVISGIGKGLTCSCIGALLCAKGFSLTSIKIDPYLNIDAGTFSPYEHGETFVLDDGAEVDLDLGNYERFMDISLTSDHNITTGKVYQHVIQRERAGDFLGKTVQVIPHITDEIIRRIELAASTSISSNMAIPQICLIEVGGTVGDMESMPYIEALRQFLMKKNPEDFCHLHMSLVIQTKNNEQKTKPTQISVGTLRGLGLVPHLLMCRHTGSLQQSTKEKIAMFCSLPASHVISLRDCSSVYNVPMLLNREMALELIMSRLKLTTDISQNEFFQKQLNKWDDLGNSLTNFDKGVRIALVGKYIQQQDSYHSVMKALEHACAENGVGLLIEWVDSDNLSVLDEIQKNTDWKRIKSCDGILVPGGFGYRGTDGMLMAIEYARINNIPFLGICLGMQLAVIEICRNVLGLKFADSGEWNESCQDKVIIEMPEHNPFSLKGGTMRVGLKKSVFVKKESITYKLYGNKNEIFERHRHRFEVNPEYVERIQNNSKLRFVATDHEKERMEICEYEGNKFHVAVQFHPEFLSRPFRPSPCYHGFIQSCLC